MIPAALSARLSPPKRMRGGLFGLGWSAAAQVIGLLVKIGSTMVLTRLLAPESYGLIGIALTVVTTLEWLSDLGVVPALLRNPSGSQREWLLVGWWIGMARSAGIAAALISVSAPLSTWYERPELFPILACLSIRPIIMSLRSPGMPELRRRLDGKRLFLDEIIQTIIGTVVTVSLAVFCPGISAWAVVLGMIAGSVVSVVTSYRLAPFRPEWYWNASIAADLAGVGRQVLGNTLLMAVWLHSDRLIGPKIVPIDAIGLYIIAWNLASAAESFLTRGTEIYFSLIIRQEDQVSRIRWHANNARTILGCVAPLLAVAAIISSPVIRVMYDARYSGVGPVLTVLIARLIVRFTGQLDFQLLLANGAIRPASVAYAIGAVAQLISVPFASAWGAIGLAFAMFGSTCLITCVQTALSPNLGRSSWLRLFFSVIVSASAIAFVFLFG